MLDVAIVHPDGRQEMLPKMFPRGRHHLGRARARPGRRSGSAMEIPAMADAPTDQNIIDPIEAEAAPDRLSSRPKNECRRFKQWFKGGPRPQPEVARAGPRTTLTSCRRSETRRPIEAGSAGPTGHHLQPHAGLIKVVTGVEISSRHETQFMPRESGPDAEMEVKANELLSAPLQWMTDECDAEDHQSEAFGDCAIWRYRRDRGDDRVRGGPGRQVHRAPDRPAEIYWDEDARKEPVGRPPVPVRTMPISRAFRQLFPGFADGHP